jgi:hypothetical protein
MARGDTDDRARYEQDVRHLLAPYVGETRVHRYFDAFAAASDWDGIRLYLERNPRS